jgi:hypothetical protein
VNGLDATGPAPSTPKRLLLNPKKFPRLPPIEDPDYIAECGVLEIQEVAKQPNGHAQAPSSSTAPTEAKHDTRPPQQRPAIPAHDKAMAARFLAGLDPNATKFTFQFFADSGNSHPQVFHGTLDEVWPKVLMCNTPQYGAGAYVTINETDSKGREVENIVRVRALFVDADGKEQGDHCQAQLEACGVYPSMAVDSGRGHHFYFLTDVPRDQFSKLQKQRVRDLTRLPERVGTIPARSAKIAGRTRSAFRGIQMRLEQNPAHCPA